jgi:osmotically-inducible protein OsmY
MAQRPAAPRAGVNEGPVLPSVGSRMFAESTPTFSLKGRGPKGYARSDSHIRHALEEALAADPTLDPSDVELTVKDGIVTLSGRVAGYRARCAVVAAAEAFVGAAAVKDALETVDD